MARKFDEISWEAKRLIELAVTNGSIKIEGIDTEQRTFGVDAEKLSREVEILEPETDGAETLCD